MGILELLQLLIPGFNNSAVTSQNSLESRGVSDPLDFLRPARTLQGTFPPPEPQNVVQLGGLRPFSNAPLGPEEPFSRPLSRPLTEKPELPEVPFGNPQLGFREFIPTEENPGSTLSRAFRNAQGDIVPAFQLNATEREATSSSRAFFSPDGVGANLGFPDSFNKQERVFQHIPNAFQRSF